MHAFNRTPFRQTAAIIAGIPGWDGAVGSFRDMKVSHAGLGITEADWTAGVTHLVATLDKFKVPAKEKDEVLAAASGVKKDIVEK